MKILHVAETVRGGIATYFNELHPRQRASFGSDNVYYVVPSDHRNDLTGIEDAQITVFQRNGRSLSGLWQMAVTTLQQIRQAKPDVVHIHSTFAGLVLRPLLLQHRGRGPRVVYCPHGWAFSRKTSRLSHEITKFVERILAQVTDQIICISTDELKAADAAGIARKRLTLVHNGLSTQRQRPAGERANWSTRKTKVLFIGRLDRQKGADVLIEAARSLTDVIDVRIIGSSVVGKRQDVVLPANVSLLGWRERGQIEAHLQEADLVVVPSRWEAFGLVALEAMRAFKPVIASRVGALPEIVEDGVTGVLCEAASVQALVTALRQAIKLDLPKVGLRGYERFRRMYDVAATHQGLSKVYSNLGGRRDAVSQELVVLRSSVSDHSA